MDFHVKKQAEPDQAEGDTAQIPDFTVSWHRCWVLMSEWLWQKSRSKYFVSFKLGGTPFKTGHLTLVTGLSKGNARVEIPSSVFFFRSVANRSVKSLTLMREVLTLTLCNGRGRRYVFAVENQL